MSNRGRHKKKPTKYPNTWLTNIMTEAQLDLLFQRAHEQGNFTTIRHIERNPTNVNIISWDRTPEGWDFWNNILSKVEHYRCNIINKTNLW